MKTWILGIVLILLSGCALKNTNLYGSENISEEDRAIISALGVYDNGNLGIQIMSINDAEVDILKTASFIVPAGTYKVMLHANKDLKVTVGPEGFGVSKIVADAEVELTVEGGHTYIPNALYQDGSLLFYFDDMGTNFQQECLPLYVVVNTWSNPGFRFYRTEKKCVQ